MAGARGPCQLQPATAWPARSSLPAAQAWGAALGIRGGSGPTKGPGYLSFPCPGPREGELSRLFPLAVTRGQGPVGEGWKADAYCFTSRERGQGLSGLLSEPRCVPSPGLAFAGGPSPWASRVTGMRVVARRLSATWGLQGFSGREQRPGGCSRGWNDSRVAVFYGCKRKWDWS